MTSTAWQHSWRLHTLFTVLIAALICYHPSVQRRVVARCVSAFEQECNVVLASSDAIFHPLMGSITFNNISITKLGAPRPLLTARRTSLAFAPAQSLICCKFVLEASVAGLRIPLSRGIEGIIDFVDFLKSLLMSSSPYITIRGLHLSDILMGDAKASVNVDIPAQGVDDLNNVSVMQGDLRFPPHPSIRNPVRIGKVVIGIPGRDGVRKLVGEIYGRADKSFLALHEGDHIKALFEHSPDKLVYRAVVPLDDVVACADGLFPGKKLVPRYAPYRAFCRAQDLLLKVRGAYIPSQRSGSVEFASGHYRSKELTSVSGSVVHNDKHILSTVSLVVREGIALRGRLFADVQRKVSRALVFNDHPAKTFFGKAIIPERGFCVILKSGTFNTVIGQYSLQAHDPEENNKKLVDLKGIFSVHDEQVCSVGRLNQKTMHGLGSFESGPRLKRFVVMDERNNVDIDVKSMGEKDERLLGTVSKRCMRQIIPRAVRSLLSGDGGSLAFDIDQSAMPIKLSGEVSLLDSNYCLQGSSNPLISARAAFDVNFMLKAATISDVECVCSSGLISSQEILLNWSPDGISYLHVPVVVNDLFINKEKDFCAIVDGECSMDWIDGGKHRVDGTFVIKKALVSSLESKDAVPSVGDGSALPYVESSDRSASLGIDANVSIKTLEPAVIHTPNLRTRAHVDARINGYLRPDGSVQPKLSGCVRLEGGVVEVLGRPLRIMRGSVDLLPSQTDNPIIDFLAYTHVKQYRITIHGSGSLAQPTFVFESSPPLSQEQIMGLVLSGSEYADINQQLPGIFLQNIHKMLDSGDQTSKPSLFQPLLKSLRYIQLLPYQDTISSEKTVKARLNIDLGPHLRALVHKDIFGKEAVALQVEYDMSDEVNLRLLRQSSGQVGAEAELRFKF